MSVVYAVYFVVTFLLFLALYATLTTGPESPLGDPFTPFAFAVAAAALWPAWVPVRVALSIKRFRARRRAMALAATPDDGIPDPAKK